MDYTPPSADAVVFTRTGESYTAPAADSVLFSPLLAGEGILSRSILNFRAIGLLESSFSLSGVTSITWLQTTTAFQFAASTFALFVTDQRALDFQSGSTVLFRAGTSAFFSTSTTIDAHGWAVWYGSVPIVGGSGCTFYSNALATTQATISCKTVPKFRGGYNALAVFAVKSKTTPRFVWLAEASSLAQVTSGSNVLFRIGAVYPSAFSAPSGSVLLALSGYGLVSTFGVYSSSSVSPHGAAVLYGECSVHTSSLCVFGSSYTTGPVLEKSEADVVYARTREYSVTVLA